MDDYLLSWKIPRDCRWR